MNTRKIAVVLSILALMSASGHAAERPLSPQIPDEARQRMSHALVLLNHGNYGAALDEYKVVYRLAPLPKVLCNIGLVHAEMGHAVEAVESLDACLNGPITPKLALTKELRDKAENKLKALQELVGSVIVTTNPIDAQVKIDDIDIDATRLAKPIWVLRGKHTVTAEATDYISHSQNVDVQPSTPAHADFKLLPIENPRLTVDVALPDVEVLIDDKHQAITQVERELEVTPGQHRFELRRAGYVSIRKNEKLRSGERFTWKEELKEDSDSIAKYGSTLALTFTEPQAIVMVTVDGLSRGEYQGGLPLAPGKHQLRAERAGFVTVERDIEIAPHRMTEASIQFRPTPETLRKIREDYERRRNWGIGTMVGGAVLTGVGAVVTGIFGSKLNDINTVTFSHSSELSTNRLLTALGGATLTVGVSTLVTGIVLIAGNADPHRYDVKPSGQNRASPRLVPMVWPGGNGATVGVVGVF